MQLTGIITGATLVGHPVRGTRISLYSHFAILGSLGWRPPLSLCLMGLKCRLCSWQTLLPYIWLLIIMVYNLHIGPWHPVVPSSPDPLSYVGTDNGLGSLPSG